MKKTQVGAVSFINLCPHDVTLMDGNGLRLTFKASGQVARLEGESERMSLDLPVAPDMEVSLPIMEFTEGKVYGLPDPEPNTLYITSYLVAKQVKRADVISPLTDSTAIRDEDNKVLGVRGFQRFK